MRCKNVKFILELPIPMSEPDGNGVVYSKESVKNAFQSNALKGRPVIAYSGSQEYCIGMIVSNKLINDKDGKKTTLHIEGIFMAGGTNDKLIEVNDGGIVVDFYADAIGICD